MEDTQDIIETYVKSAILHGKATDTGDYKTGNKHHDIVVSSYNKLKTKGEPAVLELFKLLMHQDDSVVVWAASHLLPFRTHEAEETLRQIAQKPGLIAFDAEMILKEWKAGRLKF